MLNKRQSTGMTGLYLVAAELSTRGLIVSPTSRSAQAADLLVTDGECKRAYSVQVKTNLSAFGFWLLGKSTKDVHSKTFVYALVNLKPSGPEFFVVPSKVIAEKMRPSSVFHQIDLKEVRGFQNRWDIFGGSQPSYKIIYREADLLAKQIRPKKIVISK